MKIEYISLIGHVDLRRVLTEHEYNVTRAEVDFELPTWDKLKEASWGFDDLRILMSKLEVLLYMDDKSVFHFTFEPGYITDLASVPGFVRSFVDNDDKRLVVAAMIHDALFLNHWLDFDDTNSLFRQIIKYYGNGWLAFWCWAAVSSFVGRKRYNETRPQWSKQYANCEHTEALK